MDGAMSLELAWMKQFIAGGVEAHRSLLSFEVVPSASRFARAWANMPDKHLMVRGNCLSA
jgi:hypothetical protein